VPAGSLIKKVRQMGITTITTVAAKIIRPHNAHILQKIFLKIFIEVI
jgi:hypothetical protein